MTSFNSPLAHNSGRLSRVCRIRLRHNHTVRLEWTGPAERAADEITSGRDWADGLVAAWWLHVTIELRFEGESDEQFRWRAERAAVIAKVLVQAALENVCMRQMIVDPSLPYTEDSVRRNPPVRVEYEQAIVIADLGSCLSSAKGKNWGVGPWVMPLQPDDPVDPQRVLYLYRENSVYNRRFLQRREMKRVLGRGYRSLVTRAKRATKQEFLAAVTLAEAEVVRHKLRIELGQFWRAAQGKVFLERPAPELQLEFDFD